MRDLSNLVQNAQAAGGAVATKNEIIDAMSSKKAKLVFVYDKMAS